MAIRICSAIVAIGIRIVYKLKTSSIAPLAVSWTVASNMVKMAQDTAVGVIENVFNLYAMRMPIAEIAEQMRVAIIPEYG